MFSSRVFVTCVRHVDVECRGESWIGEEKEACVSGNSCRPYGGQPVQVFWKKLEGLRLAGSFMAFHVSAF